MNDKQKIKDKLAKLLGRPPKPNEESNAETDALLLVLLLEERVDIIEKILKNNGLNS